MKWASDDVPFARIRAKPSSRELNGAREWTPHMPTHLIAPGYGPCGFVQPQWFTTDTMHLGSVPRRRLFQGLIDGSPRSANSSGGRRRPQPDDDYPPGEFGLTITDKTHRHRIFSETGRFDQLVESLGKVQKAKRSPKMF